MRLPTATQADNARAAALSAFDCADTTFIEAAFHRSRRVLCAFTARNQVRDELLTEGSGVLYKDGVLRVYMWFNFGTHHNSRDD
jgi:hypothetical protein